MKISFIHNLDLGENILSIPFSICLCLVSLFVTSCSASTPQVETPILSAPSPTPEYLLIIIPTGVISYNDYNESRSSNLVLARGIAVSIWTNRMGVAAKNREWDIIRDRVALYLDGEQVSNETLLGGPDGEQGGGLFRLSWAPSLATGLHDANFQFITDGGDVLEYGWQFMIEE
jgi:hypothetical protein